MQVFKNRMFILFFLLFLPLLTGCEGPVESTVREGETTVEAVPNPPLDQEASDAVCNPFGGGSVGRDQGLEAELFHLPSTLPHYESVGPYIQNGTKLDAVLYFDQVNVPTRPFDAGFTTLSGETLKTPEGDTLYEWFALRFESVVKLTNNDAAGKKQFALLADDGAILQAKLNDQWVTLVDDDGTHPTRFKVAAMPVDMGVGTELPIELQYFQGPRMHIAAMVLWRDWPEAPNAWKDPADGDEGNDLFFDSTVIPSGPQAAYQALLARGWRPVPAANFFLPAQSAPNPCPDQELPTDTSTATDTSTDTNTDTNTDTATATETSTNTDTSAELVITGFDGATTSTSASLIWQTSGTPSTTKIYWGTSSASLDRQLSQGSALATIHQIEVTGLDPATGYYFRAESTGADGHTVTSGVLFKATR